MDQAYKILCQHFMNCTCKEAVLVVWARDYNRTDNTMSTDDIFNFWEIQRASFMLSLLLNNTVGNVSEQCPKAAKLFTAVFLLWF